MKQVATTPAATPPDVRSALLADVAKAGGDVKLAAKWSDAEIHGYLSDLAKLAKPAASIAPAAAPAAKPATPAATLAIVTAALAAGTLSGMAAAARPLASVPMRRTARSSVRP